MSGSAARRAIAIACALLCAADVVAAQKSKTAQTSKGAQAPKSQTAPGQAPPAGRSNQPAASGEPKPAATGEQENRPTIVVRVTAGRGGDTAPVSGASVTAVSPKKTTLTFTENPEDKGAYQAEADGNGVYVFTVEADTYVSVAGAKKQLPEGGKWSVPIPLELDSAALAGAIDSLKQTNQQLRRQLEAAAKKGRGAGSGATSDVPETITNATTTDDGGPSLWSLASILLLLVGLSFQALLLLRTRAQPLEALRAPLADVENAMRSLETSLRYLLAQRDQARMALEQANRVAEQPARYAPEPTRERAADLAKRDAGLVNPAELGFDVEMEARAPVAAPPQRPATVVGEYDQARNSPDQQRAIERFERMYPGTRLSLINSDELRTNPRAIPQFQSHGRGYFLAIAEDGRWQCFPWFSFDLTDETYRSVFEYRGTNALRVTRPAILDRQGDMWTLATRGVVENTM